MARPVENPGERMSFEQLYDDHFDAIFRYVLHRVANVAEAEDLTAQTFFKVLKNFSRFRWADGNVSAWLYRIATNEVNSRFRRRRTVPMESWAADRFEDVRAEQDTAERLLGRQRLFLEINESLRTLRPDEQTLIVLRYFEDKPFPEIARILQRRAGTLATRTHRALRKLRTELIRRGIDHEELRETVERAGEAGCRGSGVQASPAQ